MKNTRKWVMAFLVSVLFICTFVVGFSACGKNRSSGNMDMDDSVRSDAVYTLNGYLGLESNKNAGSVESSVSDPVANDSMGRLTQRVTVVSDGNVLPISGTVTKMQDAFYPGTYEVRFSKNATLRKTATVTVKIDVPAGKTVYILTGNKQDGYTEVAQAVADEGKRVSFETSELVNFTISETDIIGAQEALLSVKARVN